MNHFEDLAMNRTEKLFNFNDSVISDILNVGEASTFVNFEIRIV